MLRSDRQMALLGADSRQYTPIHPQYTPNTPLNRTPIHPQYTLSGGGNGRGERMLVPTRMNHKIGKRDKGSKCVRPCPALSRCIYVAPGLRASRARKTSQSWTAIEAWHRVCLRRCLPNLTTTSPTLNQRGGGWW